MPVTISTWNVNSVKPRLSHLLGWLKDTAPDIALLQETKTVNETFPALEIEELGYNIAHHGQKSYNGVAILSKFPLSDVTTRLPGDDTDEQARYIEAVANLKDGALRVASVYVPNGMEVGADKFIYKLAFLDRLHAHFQNVLIYDEMFVAGGDYNVSPYPIDVLDAANSEGRICYHPEERARLRALHHLGLYDAFRTLHPDVKKFSWWDYRENARAANRGLRIDHLLVSAQGMDRLRSVEIEDALRDLEKPSDHAPVTAVFS